MSTTTNHFAASAMLIRKPVAQVFNAFIDPDITTKFWFTKSSGILKENETIVWTWEMFDHSFSIKVLRITTNEKIAIQWGDDPEALVT